jgi:hypothetical protein
MTTDLLGLVSEFAFGIPFFAIVAILIYYCLRRAAWNCKKREGGRNLSYCRSSSALGLVFLLAQMFYRPTVSYVLEARLEEDVEEDDQGDPEGKARQLSRQLKRIRRGEQLGDLVLRL